MGREEEEEDYGDYTTRCICGYVHDDGFMVQCDGCRQEVDTSHATPCRHYSLLSLSPSLSLHAVFGSMWSV